MQRLATQQVTAVAVGDGQWKAIVAVAHLELTFEVRAPQIIGRQDRARGLARMSDAPTAALLRHHPIATEQVANRGPMRQLPMRMTLVYQSEQLLATPRRMALARLQQRLRHIFERAMEL